MTTAPWFVALWWCFCTDAGQDPAAFPELCPHHGRKRLEPTKYPLPGALATGHRCPEPLEEIDMEERTAARDADRRARETASEGSAA